MIFDLILQELRTTNELLRRVLAGQNPPPVDPPDVVDLIVEKAFESPTLWDSVRQARSGWRMVDVENKNRPWTPEDRERLRVLWELDFSDDEIGQRLGRSASSVRCQRSRQKLIRTVTS